MDERLTLLLAAIENLYSKNIEILTAAYREIASIQAELATKEDQADGK